MILSPATAFAIARLSDRQGDVVVPQPAPSTPLFATRSVAALAGAARAMAATRAAPSWDCLRASMSIRQLLARSAFATPGGVRRLPALHRPRGARLSRYRRDRRATGCRPESHEKGTVE